MVEEPAAHGPLVQGALQAAAGKLVHASSLQQAIEHLRHHDFAGILLDLRGRGADARSAVRKLRATAQSTPILAMASAGADDDCLAALRAETGVEVLLEPVTPEIVDARVGVIMELFRAREALRTERAFLGAVLERVEDSIIALDTTGAPSYLNRAARELFEEVGCSVTPLQIPDALQPALQLARRGENVHRIEVQLPTGRGVRILQVSSKPLQDPAGDVLGALVTLHDVTALRDVQSAQDEVVLQTSRREVAEALTVRLSDSQEGLRRLAAELSEADRRKTEFLATLAHELRNPLAPLSNGVELLRMAEDRPQLRVRTREMMGRQVKQLVRLVDDLLEVARITSGKVQLRREVVELCQIIRDAVESCAPALQKHGHRFRADLPQQDIHVDGDAVRLSQVFCNLLNNAAKYTPAGGEVKLEARLEGSNVVVEVQDNGVGIRAKALPQIFDMFTQVERNIERSEGGLGIGLALVRSLVEMHGGRVAASSPGEGAGSTFRVVLPTAQANTVASAVEGGQMLTSAGYRILVVDDNVDAADSLAAVLEMRGHEVAVAHDGQEALTRALVFEPQVVFLDIGMPRMNGYEVARALRLTPFGARATLIALTGWGAERDRERTREAGFDHHLTKPGTTKAISVLLEGLQHELRERAQALCGARGSVAG